MTTEHKILVTGTMGAGRTTAIGSVSDAPPIAAHVTLTDHAQVRQHTGIGLDVGRFALDDGVRVRLFGTPGPSRIDCLWEILTYNAVGLIILIDNARPDPLADLGSYLDGFAEDIATRPCTIGIGGLDTHPFPGVGDYAQRLVERGMLLPVVGIDVDSKEDVTMLIELLLAQREVGVYGEMQ